MPFPSAPILDTGVRANQNPAVGWTKPIFTAGNNNFQILTNTIRPVASPASNWFSGAPAFGNNQEAYVTITTEDAAGRVEPVICLTGIGADATINCYLLSADSTTNILTLFRVVNGAFTSIGTYGQTIASGDSVGMQRVGADISVYYKVGAGAWTLKGTANDTTHTTGGRVGLIIVGTAQVNNFGGGDYLSALVTKSYVRRRR